MANVRDIKRKIKSVNNIGQITRAMKMIAASRIKKVETVNKASKPYAYKIKEMTVELVNQLTEIVNPLMEYRPPKRVLNIIISSDKGLCGGYNSGIIKFSQKEIESRQSEQVELILLGGKAKKSYAKKQFPVAQSFTGWEPSFNFAKQIAGILSDKFISKDTDLVNCYYVKNITSLTQAPVVEKILPLKTADEKFPPLNYIFEPGEEETVNILLKKYLEVTIYSVLLEAKTSELSARLKAMSSATDNADKLSHELSMQYFRARQEAITNEIIEVSSGAQVLK